eukprot:EG_transcript_37438
MRLLVRRKYFGCRKFSKWTEAAAGQVGGGNHRGLSVLGKISRDCLYSGGPWAGPYSMCFSERCRISENRRSSTLRVGGARSSMSAGGWNVAEASSRRSWS